MNREPLKIILSKKGPSSECAREKMPGTGENVTAACPEHLIISDLSVGKGIGPVPVAAPVKQVKFTIRSSSKAGEKVHICVKCDIPIAIYGRLPCEHAFCMDCALECRSNSKCYICGAAQIQKIQKIVMGKGRIYICGMLSCLKSFCELNAFKIHVAEVHGRASSSSVSNGGDGNLSATDKWTTPQANCTTKFLN